MTFTLPAKVRQVAYVVLVVANLVAPYAVQQGWISVDQWTQVLSIASALGLSVAAAKTSDPLPVEATLHGDHDASGLDVVGDDPTLTDETDAEEPVAAEAV